MRRNGGCHGGRVKDKTSSMLSKKLVVDGRRNPQARWCSRYNMMALMSFEGPRKKRNGQARGMRVTEVRMDRRAPSQPRFRGWTFLGGIAE